MKQRPVQSRTSSDRVLYVLLIAIMLAVYSQVHDYSFVSFDDPQGLIENQHVRDGLTWGGVVWAFTTVYQSYWIPLTWLSHMLVVQVFGMDAGWHHLINVLIHGISSVLLFALLKRMTGRVWESAFVAFVFALHPLHVESVAWVSERKDVLSAFFWFLTTWLYLDYVEKKTAASYLLVVVAFSLGLMSKPMIVTLPFALLLLDAWPLGRSRARILLLEKAPLVALAIGASAITFIAQRKIGTMQEFASNPLAERAANTLISYVTYLGNFVWPKGLAVFYPLPARWPAWQVTLAGLAIGAVTVLVMLAYRRRRYLAVGWFWYLGTLLPVIGLIQVGSQARADRYTYVPLIGISMMVAWGASDVVEKWPRAKVGLKAIAILACAGWTLAAAAQIQYWKDGITLYRHAIAVTDGNYRAHENLGVDLAAQGNYAEALRELSTSVEEDPEQANARNSLGAVLYHLGRKQEAIEQYRQGIRIDSSYASLHLNLGNALADEGRTDEAIPELNTAVRLRPDMANAYFGLGRVLVMQNRLREAIPCYAEALRLDPSLAQAREQLEALKRSE